MPKKEQVTPITAEQYRLLRDLPYYVELGMQTISGWMSAGEVVLVHDVVERDGERWVKHDRGWTLVQRMEYVYAEPVEVDALEL